MTLRLISGRFHRNAKLYCVNLLLTYSNGCIGRCSYCGLSRQRAGKYEEKSFIRVTWPIYKLTTIIERLKKYASWVERVCVSMITNKRAIEDTIAITKQLKDEINLPISLLISPTIIDNSVLNKFKEAGADMIGVAIDTATEELFIKHRGKEVKGPHKWDKYWEMLEKAVSVFGKDKAGCHLIVGLGETEKQMVETIQKVRDLGAKTHLFSFYPEEGSLLENKPSCDIDQYRRVQLARYLIDYDLSTAKDMEFDDNDRIINWGLNSNQLDEIINLGKPFQTSGCAGKTKAVACNRPFGDGPPSDIRSFPFELNKSDVKKIRQQITKYS